MIDGHTQLVGLVGWPVEHSLSPTMHNAAFDALGLNWRYIPLSAPPQRVEEAVRGLAALGFRGANVTTPHKQAVIPMLDVVASDAQAVGAVNTLVIERNKSGEATISGHNTDIQGFIGALRQAGVEPEGKKAIVVGAGGGARAVVFGLLWSGAEEIVVLNRTPGCAQSLVSDLGSDFPLPPLEKGQRVGLRALPLTPVTLIRSTLAADLLVNATTVGMWPHVDGSVWPEGVPVPPQLTVFDLVYNPLETRLLRQAGESGARAIDGLEMLVRQGALAFEMWTGETAPIEVMLAACEQILGRW